MRQDIRLGRVAGIAVGANWSTAVILVLIAWLLGSSILPGSFPGRSPALYWAVAAAGAVLFLASLLAHEKAASLGTGLQYSCCPVRYGSSGQVRFV